jgi:hypothetical protein
MTDEQIVKALECCKIGNCDDCPFYGVKEDCEVELPEEALDLINRQKVEIEGLEETRYELACIIDELLMCIAEGKETKSAIPIDINQIKSEAIKEFAERLIRTADGDDEYGTVFVFNINDLVKEMTEVQK